MATIHILQKDETLSKLESIITDTSSILEMSFTHNLVEPEKEEEIDTDAAMVEEDDHGYQDDDKSEDKEGLVEILYVGGERRNLDIATPTVLRILDDTGVIIETTDLQKFEEAYLSVITNGEAIIGE